MAIVTALEMTSDDFKRPPWIDDGCILRAPSYSRATIA